MDQDCYEDAMKPVLERFSVPVPGPVLRSEEARTLVLDQPRFSGAAMPGNLEGESHVARSLCEDNARLRQDLLGRIHVHNAEFFEHLIIDVLLHLGYGGRRRDLARSLGRSHDGGIDGIISQDELGLDVILVQAKRLKPGSTVAISHVRDFAGSLDSRQANKGVFVTTAQFPASAAEFVAKVSRRIVLISGDQLASIMIRHNIGVRVKQTYQFKELEPSYFKSVAAAVRSIPSAGM